MGDHASLGRFPPMSDALYEYVLRYGVREDETLAAIRAEASAMGGLASMQIGADQGALMGMLVGLTGARRALEVGTFTGYSAICVARALPEDGLLVACELDRERARTAQANFERAGVAERIDLRVGPAARTLAAMTEDESFDFAFIDADKTGYEVYYEECLRLLRPGGLMLIDNMLLYGEVLAPTPGGSADAIDALNRKLIEDERIDVTIAPIGDGLTFIRKR